MLQGGFSRILDSDTTTVVNKFKSPISSLSSGDIHTGTIYQESEVSLNNPFLLKFGEDHPDFDELMEN
jgi:hypothetical protein